MKLNIISFLRSLKDLYLRKRAYHQVQCNSTLIGDVHDFATTGNVVLCWGSTKNDVFIDEHADIYGQIISYNHGTVKIGKWVNIGFRTKIDCVNRIEIGDNTTISYDVTIIDNNSHPINPADREFMSYTKHGSLERQPMFSISSPIIIGNNCWIGTQVRIQKGVTIGDNSIIAANSVVTKSIPHNCIAAGIPAKIVKTNIDKTTLRVFPLKNEDKEKYTR